MTTIFIGLIRKAIGMRLVSIIGDLRKEKLRSFSTNCRILLLKGQCTYAVGPVRSPHALLKKYDQNPIFQI